MELVEGVEEGFLSLCAALQELDVVDEEDVDIPVSRLKGGAPVVRDGVDEVVRELFARDVSNLDPGIEADRVIADRVQEVGLAESGIAVDEERVVGLGRRLSDGYRGCVSEPVGLADDEVVEGVLRVQARVGSRRGVRRLDGFLGSAVNGCRGRGCQRHDRCQVRLGQVRVHDHTESRHALATAIFGVCERLEDRRAHPLIDLRCGQLIGNIEVEGSTHDALRHREIEESFELRSDAIVPAHDLQCGSPNRNIGNLLGHHGPPQALAASVRRARPRLWITFGATVVSGIRQRKINCRRDARVVSRWWMTLGIMFLPLRSV